MSRLLALTGIATAVAAVVLCVNSITWENDIFFTSMCDSLVPTTAPTDYGWGRPYGYRQAAWQEDACKGFMQMLRVRTGGSRLPETHRNHLFLRD